MQTKEEKREYDKARYALKKEEINAKAKLFRDNNKEKIAARGKRYRSSNRESINVTKKKYHLDNRERHAIKNKKYRIENEQALRIKKAEYHQRVKDCPAVRTSRNFFKAKRRALQYRAQPKWANEFFIREAYALARLRTEMFGFAWHVDHIIPLQNELVCGFHVENNLQVIPGSENCKKSNKFNIQ